MRWIVFLTFSWSAFIAWHSKRTSAVLLHLVMAILFNPVISFHFPKEVWITLDMIAALLTFLVAWASRQRNPTAQERENMGDMIGFVIGLSALIGGVVLGLYIAGLFGLGSTASGLLAFATSSAALYAAVLTFHRFRTRMPQSERGPN